MYLVRKRDFRLCANEKWLRDERVAKMGLQFLYLIEFVQCLKVPLTYSQTFASVHRKMGGCTLKHSLWQVNRAELCKIVQVPMTFSAGNWVNISKHK
mgnify:CR=1 FL=1